MGLFDKILSKNNDKRSDKNNLSDVEIENSYIKNLIR